MVLYGRFSFKYLELFSSFRKDVCHEVEATEPEYQSFKKFIEIVEQVQTGAQRTGCRERDD